MDGWIAFDGKGFVHAHAAGIRDARQIVAHEVDDHEVLRPILDRCGKLPGQRTIELGLARPWARALHRLGLGFIAFERHEQFGAQAEQPVRTVEHHPAITCLRRGTQRTVKRERIAREVACQRKGKIGLVDIARGDRLLQAGEGLGIATGRNLRFERANSGVAFGMTRKPFGHGAGRDPQGLVE